MYILQGDVHIEHLSMKLRGTLKRIRDNLIIDEELLQLAAEGAVPAPNTEDKIPAPHTSPVLNLTGMASY